MTDRPTRQELEEEIFRLMEEAMALPTGPAHSRLLSRAAALQREVDQLAAGDLPDSFTKDW